MLDVLTNLTFRKLFAAQVIALLGTGLATVALALLAYDLAGSYLLGVLVEYTTTLFQRLPHLIG